MSHATSFEPYWTDERIETLRTLWNEGHSASVIARKMQATSRSAVIGKAHRMKLPPRGQPTGLSMKRGRPGPRSKVERRKVSAAPARDKRITSLFRDQILASVQPVKDEAAPDTAVTFADLETHHCRFPYGSGTTMKFCGCQKIEGLSYCARHASVCFTVEQPRRRPVIAEHRQKVDA